MPKNMTGKQKKFFSGIASGDIKKEGVSPDKAKSWLSEQKETPADEAKESPRQQAKEKKEGTEMDSKGGEKCSCGATMVDGKCPKCDAAPAKKGSGLKKVDKSNYFKSKGIKA